MITVFKKWIDISKFRNNELEEIKSAINNVGNIIDYKIGDFVVNNKCEIEIHAELSPFSCYLIYPISEAVRYNDTDLFISDIEMNNKTYKLCFKSNTNENILLNKVVKILQTNPLERDNDVITYLCRLVTSPYNQYFINDTRKLPEFSVPEIPKGATKKSDRIVEEDLSKLFIYLDVVHQIKIDKVTNADPPNFYKGKINRVKYKDLRKLETLEGIVVAPISRNPGECYVLLSNNVFNKNDIEKIVRLLELEDKLYEYWLTL